MHNGRLKKIMGMKKMKHELDDLTRLVQQFCEARDWDQFHNPKDLAIGIATEAGELLDLFRFQTDENMAAMLKNPVERTKIGEELADVFYFLLRFSQLYGFDLGEALVRKMKINEAKYPVETAKGSNRKSSE